MKTASTSSEEHGPALKARVIIDAGNRQWILGKFAERLVANLGSWNVAAELAEEPSAHVDINHWLFYGHAWSFYFQQQRRKLTKSTMLITHLDDPIKVRIVKEALDEVADVGICVSRMTLEDLVTRKIARRALCYVTPAHDAAITPRRTWIGIASRAYPDGRKREHLLRDVASAIPLELFHFEIIGGGWESVIADLERAGATVTYYAGTDDHKQDYAYMLERLARCDYYLYLGLDEGSMGILDALAAGVETIVTRQGFHLDLEGGITHGFVDRDELIEIFGMLRARRMRLIAAVDGLTWHEYARQHAVLWRALIDNRADEISALLHPEGVGPYVAPRRSIVDRAKDELHFYLNAAHSDFRKIYADRRKWEMRARLSLLKRRVLRLL